MRAHETVGVASPVVFFNDSLHELDELTPVLIVVEYGHPSDPTAYDMIHNIRVLNPQGPCHCVPPFLCLKKRGRMRPISQLGDFAQKVGWQALTPWDLLCNCLNLVVG